MARISFADLIASFALEVLSRRGATSARELANFMRLSTRSDVIMHLCDREPKYLSNSIAQILAARPSMFVRTFSDHLQGALWELVANCRARKDDGYGNGSL